MMENTVITKLYPEPEYNKKEILRYAYCGNDSEDVNGILNECIAELKEKLRYAVCFSEFSVSFGENEIDLGFCKTKSRDLMKNLTGCEKIILFAATVGIEADRIIKKYSLISPSKAVLMQAAGTERIESLCDLFNSETAEIYRKQGYTLCPRFSPGYGDLPLEMQRDIFSVLGCEKNVGLTLNKSLIMSPSKSVTAIIGIRR